MFEIGYLVYLLFIPLIYFILFCVKNIWGRYYEKSMRYPPGQLRLPLFGNLHQLGREPFKSFMKMGEKYGDIFSLELGQQKAVILNNYKDIRDAFSLTSFSGRLVNDDLLAHCGGAPRGVILNVGRDWTDQRRFTIRTLRDFGFGKKTAGEIIQTEVTEFLENMKKVAGQHVIFSNLIYPSVSNVIWTLTNRSRTTLNDPVLLGLLEALEAAVKTTPQVSLTVFLPWLKHFQMFFPSSYKTILDKLHKKIYGVMGETIEDHLKTFPVDENSAPRSFIDSYLKEIKKTTDPTSSFYGEEGKNNLKTTMFDMFAAGSETTSTTLHWMCLLMAMYPEIQEKLHMEIREVIGLEKLPSLKDRKEMPYTEAVIAEVMRYIPLIPLSVPHAATEDTEFRGYLIPKGTTIIANVYSAMHDPKVWLNAQDFCPQRFLSAGGKKFSKPDAHIPFSIGKRICLGMNLAMDELFLFTTSLFQRFKLEPVPNGEKLRIEYTVATAVTPVPQKIMVNDRFDE